METEQKQELIKQVEQLEKQAAPPRDTMCNRCGSNITSPAKNVFNSEDQKEYLRCLCGNRAFEKEYDLFNGALKLRFSTLTTAESEMVNMKKRAIKGDVPMDIVEQNVKLKLIFMLRKARTAEFDKTYIQPKDTEWEVNDQFKKMYGDLGEGLIVCITRTVLLFDELQYQLAEGGLDANFWKGAGQR